MMRRVVRLVAAVVLGLSAAACQTLDGGDSAEAVTEDITGNITNTSSFGSAPEQIWLEKAKEAFRNGNYGLAERHYRQAIEERHQNAEAWLGLAASYDRLKRWDLAERSYQRLMEITGPTPTVLNNYAYHKMLRGDFAAARETLKSAAEKAPDNIYIRNNIELLGRWEAQGGAQQG
jgi:Flp pilus assembly protein TadD